MWDALFEKSVFSYYKWNVMIMNIPCIYFRWKVFAQGNCYLAWFSTGMKYHKKQMQLEDYSNDVLNIVSNSYYRYAK